MAEQKAAKAQAVPRPDPSLQRLNRLVGTWSLKGGPVGSEKETISGTTIFKWLHQEASDGEIGFFIQQEMEMDYDGQRIKSLELIGHDPKTGGFSSQVFSNMAGDPWPYEWDIQGNTWTISIDHGQMNATFTGEFSDDGNSFTGGWRPNPGADETINAPYDVKGTRVR